MDPQEAGRKLVGHLRTGQRASIRHFRNQTLGNFGVGVGRARKRRTALKCSATGPRGLPYKRQMHAIAAFVDEDGRRRAGARIGNLLDHLYRSQQTANNRWVSWRLKFSAFLKPGLLLVSPISRNCDWGISYDQRQLHCTHNWRNERDRSRNS
jgi:hypothetical protein